MKQTKIQLIGSLALAAIVASSCASLDKMKEAAKQMKYDVTPDPLETHAGKVAMSFKANVPAKLWDKKVVAEITPVLTYEGGETVYPSITVKGEGVTSSADQTISYTNGGQISYAKQEIDFNDKMRVSDLIVRIKFSKGDDSFEISSPELDMPALAHGVIATSTLLGQEKPQAVLGKDAFQKVINEEQSATLIYLINKADIRNGELKKDDVKAINDYINAVKADEARNLKDVVVSAYASPDGATDLNTKLASNRESSATKYIQNQLKKAKAEANVVTKNTPEDWEGFKAAMEKSNIQDKDLILRVLAMYSDPDVREKEIKNLSAAYKVIADEILPSLRRSEIKVNAELIGKSEEELKDLAVNKPEELNVEEILYAATLFSDAETQAKIYKSATEKFANDWRPINNEGVIAFNNGDVAAAKAKFQAAEQIEANATVENNLGVVAIAEKDYDKAKEYFGKAAGVGSELDQNLAVLALIEGDYEKAEQYFGASTSCNAALVKILLDKFDAALSILNANNEEIGFKYYLKAICSANKGEADALFENLRKATTLDAKWKEYAKTDMEFYKYFNDSTFKAIVE
ncbi:MAG: tetratricopeptide repeat protein [Marinilabiliaceae bacterium]|nr:tetratricopeptide repeat protein [Marinilabiliaceae bacterium]